jgi:predicted DNA-binding transcriptional regulator AlpA
MPRPSVTDLQALPSLLTIRMLREVMGISVSTAYKIITIPGFPVIRLSKRLTRIPRDALIVWLDNHKKAS